VGICGTFEQQKWAQDLGTDFSKSGQPMKPGSVGWASCEMVSPIEKSAD
jgi:hypothetical protein